MQKIPEPPKSYSLIENLRPSISLSGQTSESDHDHPERQLDLRPQIAEDLNEMIDAVQTLTIDELKKTLKTSIKELQTIQTHETQKFQLPFGQKGGSSDIVLQKLKQLAMISDILVQRMNQKYTESKSIFEDFYKESTTMKKSINMKITRKRQKDKKNARRIDVSQETEKKPVIYDQEKLEMMEKEDQKKTRKQDTKVKAKN